MMQVDGWVSGVGGAWKALDLSHSIYFPLYKNITTVWIDTDIQVYYLQTHNHPMITPLLQPLRIIF